jgi:hypothetical protein
MTSSSSDKRSRFKAYQEDCQQFFNCHPVAGFAFTFSLLFTFWSLFELFWSFAHSYGGHIASAAFYAGFVSILLSIVQRRRKKRLTNP